MDIAFDPILFQLHLARERQRLQSSIADQKERQRARDRANARITQQNLRMNKLR